MKKYIGTKVLMAVAMTLGVYNEKRGWTIPENEDPNRKGYFVEYPDGYISWSPKEVFEEAYRKTSNGSMNFGQAIEALKKGLRVARSGWNGKGMFIFMRPADELPIDFVVDKVKSIPQSVKDYYRQDIVDVNGNRNSVDINEVVKFTAYLCMKAADGTVVNGWLASQTDMLAEDWEIFD